MSEIPTDLCWLTCHSLIILEAWTPTSFKPLKKKSGILHVPFLQWATVITKHLIKLKCIHSFFL